MGDGDGQEPQPLQGRATAGGTGKLARCGQVLPEAHRPAPTAGCQPESFQFRLPTEPEWEYACRAGTSSAFNDGLACTQPTGNDLALARLGWFGQNSGMETHPVGEKLANAWGLHDMHGNVWEWCWDGKRAYTAEAQTDPLGPVEENAGRAVRGGSFWTRAEGCRSACRDGNETEGRSYSLGFRLAAGQEPGAERPVPRREARSAGAGGTRRPDGEQSEPAGTEK